MLRTGVSVYTVWVSGLGCSVRHEAFFLGASTLNVRFMIDSSRFRVVILNLQNISIWGLGIMTFLGVMRREGMLGLVKGVSVGVRKP